MGLLYYLDRLCFHSLDLDTHPSLDQVDKPEALPEAVQKLVDERQAARVARDWAMSDQLRDVIQNMGYTVQDTKDGMKVIKR